MEPVTEKVEIQPVHIFATCELMGAAVIKAVADAARRTGVARL